MHGRHESGTLLTLVKYALALTIVTSLCYITVLFWAIIRLSEVSFNDILVRLRLRAVLDEILIDDN